MRLPDRVLRQLTLANQLTLLRLAAIPLFALTLLSGANALALAIFVGAALTDLLDGLAARRLGQQTALGRVLDPTADKLMMLVTYVILSMPDAPRPFPDFHLDAHVPAWLTLLVVARDVLIGLMAVGLYFAYRLREFPPSRLGKWTTGVAMGLAGVYLIANAWPVVPSELLVFGHGLLTVLLVASGVTYLVRIRRLLREMPQEERS
jgi:cardiolipin synthase